MNSVSMMSISVDARIDSVNLVGSWRDVSLTSCTVMSRERLGVKVAFSNPPS